MRRHYIDNIRSLTVLLVVLYHVVYMFNGIVPYGVIGPISTIQMQDAVQYILYPWFMMILFVVSGVSARYYLNSHNNRNFVLSRTRKLLVPSTLGVLAVGWVQGYFSMMFSDAFLTIPESIPVPILYLIMAISGIGVLWYMQMLWLFSILLVIIRRWEKGRLNTVCGKANPVLLLLLVIPAWGCAQILNTPVIAVYRFGIYGFCFFIGYFLFFREEVVNQLQKWSVPLLCADIVLAVLYAKMYFGEDYATAPVVNSPFSILYGWITCLAIFACMRRWGDYRNRFTNYVRQKSFGIYIFHYLVISVVGYALVTYTVLPAWVVYLMTGMAAYVGAVLLYEVVARIPFLRFIILGICKK